MKHIVFTLLAATAAPIHAQSVTVVPLNVKPGQWDLRREVETLPIDLRSVPPEMRDKLVEAIREKDPPRVVITSWRACVSAEEVRAVFAPPDDPSCTNTVTGSTPTRLDAQLKCRADGTRPVREGSFTALATSSEEVHGDIRLTVGAAGQTSTLYMRIFGKWLGEGCDAPNTQQKK
jgi:hypothetical protein